MAEAFYSVVLDHPADAVWSVIRPFGHYAWAGVDAETVIEEGKADAEVGAVRHVSMPGRAIRQKLLAHSDRARSYTYSFLEPAPVPNYVATIRVTPVAETGQAFVDWRATFDCAPDEQARWLDRFERKGFAVWLAALRRFMAQNARS
ncbi:MAG: SRPBCC family protein [Reyranella sp.]|uniref:SRPBCC family protein n=1 Tax=Reyranella sp. TaxID=1929291 RepID=UPI001ACB4EAE|nr:SRPBCC family protein [Reyranella sp.]MBN9085992.1 SRPBCC family protein [Reyranella sp.]